MYIKRHLLRFEFEDLVGYGCAVGNGELVNNKLKIVFSWRADNDPPAASASAEQKRFEIIFDRYGLEGYLFGCSTYEEGYVFHGTYASAVAPNSPVEWQKSYDLCQKKRTTPVLSEAI